MQSFINPRDTVDADVVSMRSWTVRVIASMTVMTALAVTMRLVSRRIRRQKLWWDDWLCIISMFCSFGTAAVIFAEFFLNKMGYHQNELDAHRVSQLIQVLMVGEVVYGCNIAITKIAVLLLYWRLLQVAFQTSSMLRAIAYGIAVLVIVSALVFIFTVVFDCIPVQKRWQPDLPGHCRDQVTFWILNAVLTLLTDVAILVLPVPQIWKMRLGVMEKLGVASIFALGWCVTFVSAYRLHLLLVFQSSDFTYSILPVVVWSYIEISGGIVSACLPVSKPAVLWTTHKLGLTGENGCLSQLGSLKSRYGSSSKSAAGTETREPCKSMSFSGVPPHGSAEGGNDEFLRYLESGNTPLFHATGSLARPVPPETGGCSSNLVEVKD